jgi:streptomycin 6-kinase
LSEIPTDLVRPERAPVERLEELAREWGVRIGQRIETEGSLIAFGCRGDQRVVLKVVKRPGDEWRSGEVLSAFAGRGVARVDEYVDGALLLERLDPGDSLAELALSGRDDEATTILAGVVAAMGERPGTSASATADEWGTAFDRYAARDDDVIAPSLASHARQVYTRLCASQRKPRLLHGDLQHSNVLFDRQRGWVAVDPKGVVAEVEFEVGAALRNPREVPQLFTKPATIERRLRQLTTSLGLDAARAVGWAFSQAVLSAIWDLEDGLVVGATHPSLLLAKALRPMVGGLALPAPYKSRRSLVRHPCSE